MSSDEFALRVAERLMAKTRIRCIECAMHGYRFVASCLYCGYERLLTMGERDARKMVCCGREQNLLPYNKNSGLDLQQGLKNSMRKVGIPGWDRVKSWKEYNEEIWNRARRVVEIGK